MPYADVTACEYLEVHDTGVDAVPRREPAEPVEVEVGNARGEGAVINDLGTV